MSDLFGWRSIFLVNMPIGMVVLGGLIFMLPYRKPNRRPKIDYAGAILLALTTTSVVLPPTARRCSARSSPLKTWRSSPPASSAWSRGSRRAPRRRADHSAVAVSQFDLQPAA
jgi:MFS family permease